MNEREKKAVERIEDTFYSDLGKGINKFQKITLYEDGIRDVRILLNLLEKLQKENEELKEKENKIYKEVQESLAFEKFLIVKERKPDLFNQGRFYISQIIYDILNDVQNPEGIHKENKCIQYIDYIPVQRVKDKIEKIKQEKKKYGNCLIEMYEDELVNRDIKILQELIEEREEK